MQTANKLRTNFLANTQKILSVNLTHTKQGRTRTRPSSNLRSGEVWRGEVRQGKGVRSHCGRTHFFCKKALTEKSCQGRNRIVETNEHKSLKASLPDNAGELRSREARTASFVRHTSPALSGFFVRTHRRVGVS